MLPEHCKVEIVGKNGVKVTHIPTGEHVICNAYKSQPENKRVCMELLEKYVNSLPTPPEAMAWSHGPMPVIRGESAQMLFHKLNGGEQSE